MQNELYNYLPFLYLIAMFWQFTSSLLLLKYKCISLHRVLANQILSFTILLVGNLLGNNKYTASLMCSVFFLSVLIKPQRIMFISLHQTRYMSVFSFAGTLPMFSQNYRLYKSSLLLLDVSWITVGFPLSHFPLRKQNMLQNYEYCVITRRTIVSVLFLSYSFLLKGTSKFQNG